LECALAKEKKPEELPPANIPPVEWSTRFQFFGGSESRIENKHVCEGRNKCVSNRYAPLAGEEMKSKPNWSDRTKVKRRLINDRARVRLVGLFLFL
jgi:hypothetical protein